MGRGAGVRPGGGAGSPLRAPRGRGSAKGVREGPPPAPPERRAGRGSGGASWGKGMMSSPFPGEGGAWPREEVGATPRLPQERARRVCARCRLLTVPSPRVCASAAPGRAGWALCPWRGMIAPCPSGGSWGRHRGKAPRLGREFPA